MSILPVDRCKLNAAHVVMIISMILIAGACGERKNHVERPIEPWAFRSVLDKKPRMLTLALDSSCYVAYDLANCILYKAWKGGVLMEGTAYTDKKNVQPTSWGKSYLADSVQRFQWMAEVNGTKETPRMISKGYVFRDTGIVLKWLLISSSGDSISIEEQPEFIRSKSGAPGLERSFRFNSLPKNMNVMIESRDTTLHLKSNAATVWPLYFKEPPMQSPPQPEEGYDHRGRYWMEKSDCMTCHEFDRQTVGPAFRQIAQKYPKEKTAIQYLIRKIKEGGSGVWGTAAMNPHPDLKEREVREMLNYIFSLAPKEDKAFNLVSATKEAPRAEEKRKPGHGAPLEAVHPAFDLQTIHRKDFRPKVGGLAFLPDGRLLVTTWDVMGGVYLLDNVASGDTSKISVKRIASGLAEPLGIEVVDGEIYVLQKHELTHLIDHDGDEVIDEYEAVCNSWGVTSDFHEFAFGLVYKDGYFYATLSMAMRLLSGERQQPDRGKTIRIRKDGTYEWINYGLRTPNGIGLGVDDALFVTDNQGEWLPANKLIHVKEGEYLGMHWGLPDTLPEPPPVSPPALWLPENEIGNSPTEPVYIPYGPYKGQMLHGDVTHGGIKRDFLEKINNEYQGAVFRFTQGLEAGVNRLCWGPDSALYIGGVGMVGGWSWKEKQYGLQKMKHNGKPVFEMLAVRARPKGFEIELTQPLESGEELKESDLVVQQWYYLATENYGGPKLDQKNLGITRLEISGDRKRIYLEIEGLKKRHVVYLMLPHDLTSASGEALWSSEAWYTLNNIPE
jgi:cytochrome c